MTDAASKFRISVKLFPRDTDNVGGEVRCAPLADFLEYHATVEAHDTVGAASIATQRAITHVGGYKWEVGGAEVEGKTD